MFLRTMSDPGPSSPVCYSHKLCSHACIGVRVCLHVNAPSVIYLVDYLDHSTEIVTRMHRDIHRLNEYISYAQLNV